MSNSQRYKEFQEYCDNHGLKITPPRKAVFDIITGANKPLTAYEILDEMGSVLDKPKPPTAYRAIEFLYQHGFIHRIESLNAYISCAEDHKHKGSQFMICDQCGRVEEVHLCSIPTGLRDQAEGKGFTLSFWSVELHGTCSACA